MKLPNILDSAIEAKIMEEIYTICENKTLIVIAHRLNRVAECKPVFDRRTRVMSFK